jgi:hypothetical protein
LALRAGVLAGVYGFLIAIFAADDGFYGVAFAGGDAVADCVADDHGDDGQALVGVDLADCDEGGDADEGYEGY